MDFRYRLFLIVLAIFFGGGLLLAGPVTLLFDRIAKLEPDKAHYFFGEDVDRNGEPIDEDF